MTVLKVLHHPDPRLKVKTKLVEKVDAEINRLLDDMLETMYFTEGVGLAATQVGLDQRICVMDYSDTEAPNPVKMVNPEIIWTSPGTTMLHEGCLSIPKQQAQVKRFLSLKVRYLDERNQIIEREASGNLAHVIQHEIDHLNGILYIDHLSSLKRNLLLQRYKKTLRSEVE